jgi:hypothetical protein
MESTGTEGAKKRASPSSAISFSVRATSFFECGAAKGRTLGWEGHKLELDGRSLWRGAEELPESIG